ncbi:Alkyltransferase-like protein 1 [Microsporum ferrugineum]
MARTDEAEWWFNAVYEAIQQIPYGKVTSYGHIARLLGCPQRSRQVGICLKHLPSSPDEFYNNDNVPWQRVINSKGMISHRPLKVNNTWFHVTRGPGSAARQAAALEQEGVSVRSDGMNEFYIDMAQFGWFPDRLPNEDDEDGDLDADGLGNGG